jgi:rubrerythrin
MKDEQVRELLYQALETELGGVDVYTTALRCAENDDLKEEWDKYLEQTKNHVAIMEETLRKLGLDPDEETPGRQVVRTIGEALVEAMELALAEGEPGPSELASSGRSREERHGSAGEDYSASLRAGRRGGGRTPLSQQRLGARTLDRIARHEGCAAAA